MCIKFTRAQRTSELNKKLPKNYVLLVYDEKLPRHFWEIAIITNVSPSRDSEIKGAIVKIKKTNATLKRHPIEYTYHGTH